MSHFRRIRPSITFFVPESEKTHFRNVPTDIEDRALLLKALDDMGCKYEVGEKLRVRAALEPKVHTAEVVVKTGSVEFDIGFAKENGAYHMTADWYGIERVTAMKEKSFLQELNYRYAYHLTYEQVRLQANEENMILEEPEVLENGDVVFVLTERG